ncbi:MAG: tyrosine-type recombinase/integrase, partial [Candidatus Brocadiae bacterium]|nr:tyrosine-type recombinase/integrase [Candidatus Brocadiia bacterium]
MPCEDDLKLSLREHLKGFLQHLEAHGVTAEYLSMTESRLEKAFARVGADVFSDLNATKAEQLLLDMQRKGASKKTRNDYCSTMRQFATWVSVTKGWPNAFAALSRLKGQDDVRLRRRALTADRLRRLFEAAENRSVAKYLEQCPEARAETLARLKRFGLERAMVYRLGALAGLRVNEIRTLTWGCLDLAGSPPTCTVKARHAKSRRRDTIPLHSGPAAALRRWQDLRRRELGRPPLALEKVVRVPRHLSDEQFRKDCEVAGIALEDETGAVLDLYAATRHTFCTLLAQAGVAPHR